MTDIKKRTIALAPNKRRNRWAWKITKELQHWEMFKGMRVQPRLGAISHTATGKQFWSTFDYHHSHFHSQVHNMGRRFPWRFGKWYDSNTSIQLHTNTFISFVTNE